MLAHIDQEILEKAFPGQVTILSPTSVTELSKLLTSSRLDIVHLLAMVEPSSGKILLGALEKALSWRAYVSFWWRRKRSSPSSLHATRSSLGSEVASIAKRCCRVWYRPSGFHNGVGAKLLRVARPRAAPVGGMRDSSRKFGTTHCPYYAEIMQGSLWKRFTCASKTAWPSSCASRKDAQPFHRADAQNGGAPFLAPSRLAAPLCVAYVKR